MKTSAWRESWPADVQWSPQNLFGVGLKIEESDTKPSNDWKPCLSLNFSKAALAGEPGKGWITWLRRVALKRFSQCTTPRKNRSMPKATRGEIWMADLGLAPKVRLAA